MSLNQKSRKYIEGMFDIAELKYVSKRANTKFIFMLELKRMFTEDRVLEMYKYVDSYWS